MNTDELLKKWHGRARRAQIGHFETVARLERLKYWLGVPVIGLTTMVGSSVFISLQKETDTRIKVATVAASLLAAILASVQTFLRHSERAESHRKAAAKYGRLKKDIERIQAFPPASQDEIKVVVDELLERNDLLANDSPPIPKRIWSHAEHKVNAEHKGGNESISRA